MKTGELKQSILFKASAKEVYDLLLKEALLSNYTGSKAIMSQEIDGKFDLFDGYCTGYNIELLANKKIVQAWHFEEDGWPADHYSICTFLFTEKNDETILDFHQENIPVHKVVALEEGWETYFWTPMKAYLENK